MILSAYEHSLAAIAPLVSATGVRVRQIQILPAGALLPILLVIVLVIAVVMWTRRSSGHGSHVARRPDEWPARPPQQRPQDEEDGSSWQ